VGDTCAIAVRLSLDEMAGAGRLHQCRGARACRPCMPTCRTSGTCPWHLGGLFRHLALQGGGRAGGPDPRHQAADAAPVVGVGRFTSPDQMVRQVKAGASWISSARHGRRSPIRSCRRRSRRADRGHPRMHRLQHLRHRRHDHGACQPLHAEPRLHGGMAQGLASGADAQASESEEGAGRRGQAPRGCRRRTVSASAAMRWRWPRPAPKWAGA
jgi:hypothetical protein